MQVTKFLFATSRGAFITVLFHAKAHKKKQVAKKNISILIAGCSFYKDYTSVISKVKQNVVKGIRH